MVGAGFYADECSCGLRTPHLSALMDELRSCLLVRLADWQIDARTGKVSFQVRIDNIGENVVFSNVKGMISPLEFIPFSPQEFDVNSLPPGASTMLGKIDGQIDPIMMVRAFLISKAPAAKVSLVAVPSFVLAHSVTLTSMPRYG